MDLSPNWTIFYYKVDMNIYNFIKWNSDNFSCVPLLKYIVDHFSRVNDVAFTIVTSWTLVFI